MRSVYFRLINNSRIKFTYTYQCKPTSVRASLARYGTMLRVRLSVKTRRRLLSLGKSICFGSFCACRFSLIFSLDLVVSHTRANRSARATCYVCSVRNSTTNSIDSKRLSILIKFLVTNLSFSCTVSFLLFFPFFGSALSAFHPFILSFFHSFILRL